MAYCYALWKSGSTPAPAPDPEKKRVETITTSAPATTGVAPPAALLFWGLIDRFRGAGPSAVATVDETWRTVRMDLEKQALEKLTRMAGSHGVLEWTPNPLPLFVALDRLMQSYRSCQAMQSAQIKSKEKCWHAPGAAERQRQVSLARLRLAACEGEIVFACSQHACFRDWQQLVMHALLSIDAKNLHATLLRGSEPADWAQKTWDQLKTWVELPEEVTLEAVRGTLFSLSFESSLRVLRAQLHKFQAPKDGAHLARLKDC